MDDQQPKPRRDWRSFGKEYVIVVLGVATALAAQQAADWLHWQNEVKAARQVIASEMAGNVQTAIIRLRIQNCVEQRLDVLGAIIAEASRNGGLPAVGQVGIPPRRQWNSGAWNSVVASEVGTHFSREQLASLASSYNFVELARPAGVAELEVWSSLSTISGPGRRLDPASEAELRKALSLARTYNRNLAGLSFNLLMRLQAQNLPYNRSELEAMAAARDQPLADGALTSQLSVSPISVVCGPLGAAPAQYGQSPLSNPPARLEQAMKLVPGVK